MMSDPCPFCARPMGEEHTMRIELIDLRARLADVNERFGQHMATCDVHGDVLYRTQARLAAVCDEARAQKQHALNLEAELVADRTRLAAVEAERDELRAKLTQYEQTLARIATTVWARDDGAR